MGLPQTWATHWEFFQNVPISLTETCPVGSFKSFQNKLSHWFNFTTNSQWAHWVYDWICCSHIVGTFWKNSQWVAQVCARPIENKLWKNPRSSFKGLPYRYIDGFFQNTFKTYPPGMRWVNCLKTLNKLTMCLPGKTPSAPSVPTQNILRTFRIFPANLTEISPVQEMLRTFTVYPGNFLIRKYVGKFKMYPKNVPTVFLGGSFKVFFVMSPAK